MRVLYFSEALVPPFDEGIKKASWSLLRELQREHDVLALTNRGPGVPDANVDRVQTNRLLASPSLWQRVRRFRPEWVIYLPTACATLASFLRARLLSFYAGAPTDLVALQPRRYGALGRMLIPMLRCGPVWTQGQATARSLSALGCDVRTLPPAVDAETFVPAEPELRASLRAKYGVPGDTFVVLHVGHITASRNIPSLAALQGREGIQVALVGSTAFGADEALASELKQAGVTVLDRYLPHVEEVYQLADCYAFPVRSAAGSIEAPLSVLEAMSCNLPVVTTPFGALPALFGEGGGVYYYAGDDELLDAIRRARNSKTVHTRDKVMPYTWAAAARCLTTGTSFTAGIAEDEE